MRRCASHKLFCRAARGGQSTPNATCPSVRRARADQPERAQRPSAPATLGAAVEVDEQRLGGAGQARYDLLTVRLLQHAAMASIALGSDKTEPAALELQADVTSAQAIDGIEIQLPPALADMTVLSYKPVQTRVDALSHKATVRF